MDRDATAMMGALARSLAAATADPPAYFSQLTACMRGPCQQEVSKCRQGRQAPCLPATAKKGARAACEELRVCGSVERVDGLIAALPESLKRHKNIGEISVSYGFPKGLL